MDEQEMEDMLQQLLESMADGLGGEDRPYQSPPQVDYRGEFKPEMIQLLSLLNESQRQRGVQGDKTHTLRKHGTGYSVAHGRRVEARERAMREAYSIRSTPWRWPHIGIVLAPIGCGPAGRIGAVSGAA